jgi:hypothetical protein
MIQALGWLGSALIVASLTQTRAIPFRLLNLASAAVLFAFNLVIGLWSMVVLNSVILIVNLWQLRVLAGDANDGSATASSHPTPVAHPWTTAASSSDTPPVTATPGPRRSTRPAFGLSASVPSFAPGSYPVRREQGTAAARHRGQTARSRNA